MCCFVVTIGFDENVAQPPTFTRLAISDRRTLINLDQPQTQRCPKSVETQEPITDGHFWKAPIAELRHYDTRHFFTNKSHSLFWEITIFEIDF
jgi:hypothetical protein